MSPNYRFILFPSLKFTFFSEFGTVHKEAKKVLNLKLRFIFLLKPLLELLLTIQNSCQHEHNKYC